MSVALLHEHRRVWRNKPVLAEVYGVWFDLLQAEVPRGGRVLEIGAGPGFLGDYMRDRRPDVQWIAADVLRAPWHNLAADCQAVPLRPATVDAVIALDTLHHLARPAHLFAEAARVLRPGGRLAAIEPWVTPMSYPIYRFLHREGCNLDLDPWNPFALSPTDAKEAFDGDAAVVFKLLRSTPAEAWRALGLGVPRARVLNGFAYLLSLGFQKPSLLPRAIAPATMWLDRALEPIAPALGMRVLAVWMKEPSSSGVAPAR